MLELVREAQLLEPPLQDPWKERQVPYREAWWDIALDNRQTDNRPIQQKRMGE